MKELEEADALAGLFCQMDAQVGFRHRCNGMPADRRMAIQTVYRSIAPNAEFCEVMAENCEAAKRWHGGHHRHKARLKYFRRQINHLPDAADARRRIERGTNLVVDVSR